MGKWFDLGIGLLGMVVYVLPPYKPRDIASVLIALGFILRFVLETKFGA
jgi:hypothetical protein